MEMNEQLPGLVLAELFSKSLVCTDDEVKSLNATVEKHKTSKDYLGEYQKKIIVLINNDKETYLNESDLNFLTGILNACKLNFSHIALINFNNDAVQFQQLKKKMQPAILMCFGINTLQIQLPFTMPHYQVQQYDKCQIVTAPSLSELNQQTQQSKTEKAKLWKSLQKLFSLEK
jgi:hypothetical protein